MVYTRVLLLRYVIKYYINREGKKWKFLHWQECDIRFA
jgi:hypothetical protein